MIRMNRTHKRIKMDNGSSSGSGGSSVMSGNFMRSSLFDDPNDDVEMAIPSPDASNNEVTVNSINPDHDDIIAPESIKKSENVASIIISEPSKGQIMSKISATAKARYNNNDIRKLIIENGGSISGGITLDKTNKSLKNLIYYIKSAYSNNLTSPKWKNFKGLKLQVMEKIRLNNVIWRTWFEQCKLIFIFMFFLLWYKKFSQKFNFCIFQLFFV